MRWQWWHCHIQERGAVGGEDVVDEVESLSAMVVLVARLVEVIWRGRGVSGEKGEGAMERREGLKGVAWIWRGGLGRSNMIGEYGGLR